jgi:fyn-related kinase
MSLESEAWFFGKITRSKAEKLLMNPMRKHGCYLIRESESAPGQYSLSMRDGDSVRHFRVQTLDDGKYRLQGSPSPPFVTLSELVCYFSPPPPWAGSVR